MEIIRIPRLIQDVILKEKMRGKKIGFVPTMGALHKGHLSLVRAGRQENDMLVVSIFVNPKQFGPSEDFRQYPGDIEGDTEKLKKEGIDMLFLPESGSIYPEGHETSVTVGGLSGKLCGRFRPGHFDGVATVVTKLFNIVSPDRAYFGAKDYQQTIIVKKLVKDLNIPPLEVVVCPTVREPDGLAMSSRNAYLNVQQRKAASAIYRCLELGKDKIQSGIIDMAEINNLMEGILKSEPLISEIQYASVYDPESLDEIKSIKSEVLLAAAVNIGGTRLIDSMLIKYTKEKD